MSGVLVFIGAIVMIATVLAGAWLLARAVRARAQLRRTLDLQMMQVLVPKDLGENEREEGIGEDAKNRISVAEQFLSTLSNLPTGFIERILYGRPIVVFEIVALSDGTIAFYAGTERRYVDHMEKQIYAHYPEAEVRLAADATIFDQGDTIYTGTLRLSRKPYIPLATYKDLEVDPMQALTGALAKLQKKDAAIIQYVLQPASGREARAAARAARKTTRGRQKDVAVSGNPFSDVRLMPRKGEAQEKLRQERLQLTRRMQERIERVEQKASEPQFDVNIRIGVSARMAEEAQRIFNGVVGAFSQYALPDLNSLRLLRPRKPKGFLQHLIFRVPLPRAACVLSTTEIASLYHFPLATTSTPNITWRGSKIASAPAGLPTEGVVLGYNKYRGIETPIHISSEDRRRHVYVIGQTGTGKTTFLLNMISQDISAGRGVCVVDPHGDLIEDVMLQIPPERHKDVVLFDPRDKERPLGFNILETSDEAQKDLIVNEVVQILQKLAARLNPESIGPMFEHYLRNALLALVSDPRSTLLDVPRMFVDEQFRSVILAQCQEPTVVQFWQKEFAQSQRGQMSADMLSYVISKLGRFISNELMRNMIGQATSAFDVRKIMDEQKILLCNLSKGMLGDINSDLLGFVLVSKIQIAALSRANIAEEARKDFYLYLDEFQNFTTDSITTILSEARKYKLNLTLAHQYIQQLDPNIRDAVFGNVGTIVSYRVGADDGEFLEKHFSPVFHQYDLLNLERFIAVIRLLAAGTPQRAFSLAVPPPLLAKDIQGREAIRIFSREIYGRSRVDVHQEIIERFAVGNEKTTKANPPSGDYLSESLFDIS